jgi:hypothetical protein
MGLALVLWRVRAPADLRPPWRLLPFVPHAIVALVLAGLYQYIRDHSAYQQVAFAWGPHMWDNFLIFVAHLGNPFGVNESSSLHWRSAVPIAGVGLSALWLLAGGRNIDWRVRVLVVAWLLAALLPLTTYRLGMESRKLYAAGAPFALMLAMAAVGLWDQVALRLRPIAQRPYDLRYAPIGVALLFVAVVLPLRAWQTTDAQHMAIASITRLDGATYKAMIDQVRREQPVLPEGVRLDLAGVPWTLRVFNQLDQRLVDAIRIYYGDIEIAGAGDPAELPPAPAAGRRLVVFSCPPVCAPPIAQQDPGAREPDETARDSS